MARGASEAGHRARRRSLESHGHPARSALARRGEVSATRPVRLVLWTAVGAFLGAGCGGVAWQEARYGTGRYAEADVRARELPRGLVAAAPPGTTLGSSLDVALGAMGDPREAIEGPVPRFEIFVGALPSITIANKIAGHDGAAPPNTVRWNDAFDSGSGFEVVVNLRRPARTAIGLTAGDTFVGVRVSIENYPGLPVDPAPGGGIGTFEDMTLIGVWLDARTLLNPLDLARRVRPYLHYGGGLVSYPEVAVGNQLNWDATMALGWHMAVGIEARTGRLGAYFEAGIQAVGPPDVADAFAVQQDIDDRTAHTFMTFPVRVGLMVAF